MPLVSIPQLMSACRAGSYAVGYFESWNLESLQGVLDAAEQTRSPVIVGFNGDFLSHAGRLASERLALYGALGRAAAESATVPCGFIFNECPDDAWVLAAVDAGFNLVMPADPSCSYDEYAQRVKRIVAHARDRSVAVEAELGELPCGTSLQNRDFSRNVQRPTGAGSHSGAAAPTWRAVLPPCGATGSIESEGQFTDPHDAERFVRETGVDLLAVSVGNVHIQMTGESELDLERLAAIRARVPVPLVLHGGTGITRRSLQAAIGLGVAKVNYGTYLKQHYLRVLRERLVAGLPSVNPHELLGMGGPSDLLVAGRIAVRDAVLERITTLGCCGRA